MMNHNVMRDPLRAGMEARAHGLPKLLLGVAAGRRARDEKRAPAD